MSKTPEERKARLEALSVNIRQNAELYKRVFAGKDGQAILKDLAQRCYVDRTTYEPLENKMAFNEGRRSIFVHINNLVNKDTEAILDELKGDK